MSGTAWTQVLAVVTMCVGALQPMAAQREEPKALFGQTPQTTRPISTADITLYGGAGESLSGDDLPGQSTALRRYYSGVQSLWMFTRRQPNRIFSASVGTSVRYFPQTRELLTIDRSARLGLDTRLGSRGRFNVTQSVRYTPFRSFGPLLGVSAAADAGLPPVDADNANAVGAAAYEFGTTVGLLRNFRRSSLSLGYTSRVNLGESSDGTMQIHRAGIGFRRSLGRYATLVLGTASRLGRTRTGGATLPTRTQDFDIGLDYNRPLSFARHTTLTFTSGTALVTQTGTTADPSEPTRRLRLTGTVSLVRSFGRDWRAELAYDRNLQFIEVFPEPFYGDAIMSRLTGQMGRRASLRLQVDYSTGKALEQNAVPIEKRFRGAQTQARLSFALSRRLQIYVEHHYAQTELSAGALESLPTGLMPRRLAHGVRMGLQLWAPHVH